MARSPWRAATSPSSWSTAPACRSSPGLPIAFVVTAAHRGAVRAHALCARLRQEPSRPGAVHHRPRLHVGRRGRLRHGVAAGLHPDPERAAGPLRDLRRRRRTLSAADHRDLRAARRSRCSSSCPAPASAAGCAPRSTTRASPAGWASTSTPCSPLTFAVGSGLAGLGGALGAEILGLDPTFPLKYMIYFLIVVTVGGTSSITGPFARLAVARHRRRRRQILRPEVRGLRHLHHHDRRPDLAAAGPVRPRRRQVATRAADADRACRTRLPAASRDARAGVRSNSPSGWRRWRACSCCPAGT